MTGEDYSLWLMKDLDLLPRIELRRIHPQESSLRNGHDNDEIRMDAHIYVKDNRGIHKYRYWVKLRKEWNLGHRVYILTHPKASKHSHLILIFQICLAMPYSLKPGRGCNLIITIESTVAISKQKIILLSQHRTIRCQTDSHSGISVRELCRYLVDIEILPGISKTVKKRSGKTISNTFQGFNICSMKRKDR